MWRCLSLNKEMKTRSRTESPLPSNELPCISSGGGHDEAIIVSTIHIDIGNDIDIDNNVNIDYHLSHHPCPQLYYKVTLCCTVSSSTAS
jgi:hypothetical protein